MHIILSSTVTVFHSVSIFISLHLLTLTWHEIMMTSTMVIWFFYGCRCWPTNKIGIQHYIRATHTHTHPVWISFRFGDSRIHSNFIIITAFEYTETLEGKRNTWKCECRNVHNIVFFLLLLLLHCPVTPPNSIVAPPSSNDQLFAKYYTSSRWGNHNAGKRHQRQSIIGSIFRSKSDCDFLFFID